MKVFAPPSTVAAGGLARAHDRAEHSQREVVFAGRSRRELHQVVEDVGTGAKLGDAVGSGNTATRDRAARRDLPNRVAALTQVLGHIGEPAALVPAGLVGGAVADFGVVQLPVGRDAGQLDAAEPLDRCAQLRQLVDRIVATPPRCMPVSTST